MTNKIMSIGNKSPGKTKVQIASRSVIQAFAGLIAPAKDIHRLDFQACTRIFLFF